MMHGVICFDYPAVGGGGWGGPSVWSSQQIADTASAFEYLIGWDYSPTLDQYIMFEDDRFYVSSDGDSWGSPITPPYAFSNVSRAVHDGNIWMAVGAYSSTLYAFTSSDGTNWTQVGTSTGIASGNIYAMAADGTGKWVIAQQNTIFYTAGDGNSWAQGSLPAGTDNWAYGAAYGNGTFVIVMRGGGVRYSTNGGASWNVSTGTGLTTPVAVRSLEFIDGVFYVTDTSGNVASSTDGNTWTLHTGKFLTASTFVTYTGQQWVALNGSDIWATADSDPTGTWTQYTNHCPNTASEIGYFNGCGGRIFYFEYPNPDQGMLFTHTGTVS